MGAKLVKNMNKEKISVIIPCYNSEKSIGIVVDGVKKALALRDEFIYEIVLVNDYSKDHTWNTISAMAEEDHNIVALSFSKNFGQHNALMAAFRQVTGDYIVGLDDDGEHDPQDIFKLIDKIQEGYDYVCAEYEENRGMFRGFGTKVNNWMASALIDKPTDITLTSFYAMRRFVVDEIVKYDCAYPYVAGLLLRVTQNLATVPMTRKERLFGHSGYNLKKMMRLWINGFTAFSVKPLRIATLMGTIIAILGMIGAIAIIVEKVFIREMAVGYASIMVCIIFFSGVIMILLGMIGEYLGRIYICMNKSPQYVIRDKVDRRAEEE